MSESEKSSGSVVSSEGASSSELSSEESSSLWSSLGSSGESSAPSSGESSAPSSGESSAPSSGESSAPSSGESSAPSSGESSAPSSGEASAPSSGEASAPSSGESGQVSGEESSQDASGDFSDPQSSGESSSSPSCEECPEVEWDFRTEGALEGDGWETGHDGEIWFAVETSGIGELDNGEVAFGDCGGVNNNIQSGTATATIVVPSGKEMTIEWILKAVVESEDAGKDFAWFSIDSTEIARIESAGDDGECVPYMPPPVTGTEVLGAGTYQLVVGYDTVDRWFHTSDFGVDFWIKSCCLKNAP